MNLLQSIAGRIKAVVPNQQPFWVLLRYEDLPTICFICGMLGHGYKHCEYAASYLSIERSVGNGCWLGLKGTRSRDQIFQSLPLPSKRGNPKSLFHPFFIHMSRFHRKLHPVQCRLRLSLPPIHPCLKFQFVMSCRKWILKILSVLVTLLFNLTMVHPRKPNSLTSLFKFRISRKVFWIWNQFPVMK
ncbi:hypothetical protein LINGRAHAP2_LOCUS22756 [Linum grandiflorum]